MIDLAFPLVYDDMPNNERVVYKGMTLRDYFAAKAMQAMLSEDPGYHQKHKFFDLADFSYRCADAMLKERQQ
jgi:hypothetical protein